MEKMKKKSVLEQLGSSVKPATPAAVARLKQASQRFGCVHEKPLTRAQQARAVAAQTPN